MKPLLLILCAATIGCANLPPRTYSLGYTDEQGRTIQGGVSFGDTRLPAQRLGTGKTILPPQVEL